MVDRVVLDRQRAVAARVRHLEVEILVHLLAGLHLVREVLPLPHAAAAALVDRELGVDQILVVLHEPLGAVEIAAFFVGREREDQVAIRLEAFVLQPNQVGHELRRHRLVVAGAAAVEEAVLLDERERIHRPVLALRFDDVEVREEKERLARAGAAVAEDQVALARIGSEDLHVGGGEARRLQPRRDRLGRLRDVAGGRVGRVDLDQLLVNLPRARIVRTGLRGDDRGGEQRNDEGVLHPAIIDGRPHGSWSARLSAERFASLD